MPPMPLMIHPGILWLRSRSNLRRAVSKCPAVCGRLVSQPVAARLPDGKVLVLGGFRNPQNLHEQPTNPPYAEKYDPVAHVFSALANLTLSRDGYTATLLANGELLLAGGEDLGHTVGTSQLLNPDTGSLIDTGDLITERKGHTATLLNDGRVLITGGVDSNGVTLASAELYW